MTDKAFIVKSKNDSKTAIESAKLLEQLINYQWENNSEFKAVVEKDVAEAYQHYILYGDTHD